MILKRIATISLVGLTTGLASTPALANVTGNNSQNFNPATGGNDFVTVQSSTVLAPGRFGLGLFFNQAANTLPYQSDEHQSRSELNDSVVGADVMIGAGVLPRLELGVALPFVVDQSVDEDDTRGEFETEGNTEIKPVIKFAAVQGRAFGLALILSANINRLQDDPQAGAENSATYNAEIAMDRQSGRLRVGLNLGYRARQPGERIEGSLVEPFGNEAIASTALAYAVTPKASLVTEIFASKLAEAPENDTDREAGSAEAILGVRYKFTDDVTGHFGGGSELMHGFATPDWRVYAGIATEVGPGASKGYTTVEKKKKKKAKKQPVEDVQEPIDDGGGMAAVPEQEPDEVFILHNINFEFDSDYRVLPGAVQELDKLTAHLEKTGGFQKLVIEGHTDYFGTDEYNDDLSNRRAATVRRQLIKHYGLEADKLVSVGYGEYSPMTDDMSDAGRQLNRRVEIKIYRTLSH